MLAIHVTTWLGRGLAGLNNKNTRQKPITADTTVCSYVDGLLRGEIPERSQLVLGRMIRSNESLVSLRLPGTLFVCPWPQDSKPHNRRVLNTVELSTKPK